MLRDKDSSLIRCVLLAAIVSMMATSITHAQQFQPTPASEVAAASTPPTLTPDDTMTAATLPDAPVLTRPFLSSDSPRPSRANFFLLSAVVYGVAFLDMHQTLSLGSHVDEHDPLVRPFVHMPPPAYYATGAALATGMNWLGWRISKSRRWRRMWWAPQLTAIAANSFGYGYTLAH
jgi:hypothetical protein